MIEQRIKTGRIIPIISIDEAADVIPLCKALEAGGLKMAEVTFRTKAAAEAIALVAREFPDFTLGAGTVTTPPEVEAAKQAGAQFAVAPGLNPRVVRAAQAANLPFFPGVATASDIEAALDCGCQLLKYFPAEPMGGLKMIKALVAPYKHRGVAFIPTGGINAANFVEYLATEGVAAVGGSWLTERAVVKARDWAAVTRLTREAVAKL